MDSNNLQNDDEQLTDQDLDLFHQDLEDTVKALQKVVATFKGL